MIMAPIGTALDFVAQMASVEIENRTLVLLDAHIHFDDEPNSFGIAK